MKIDLFNFVILTTFILSKAALTETNWKHILRWQYPITFVTCSAIWGLLDKDDDLRASHELEGFCR